MIMRKGTALWQFGGFSLTVLVGTLLHFLYDLTNKCIIAAPFSSVNESTWEHMKLLFFPMFLFSLIQSRFFKEHRDFWCIKLIGILTGLLSIPFLFYTYNGVFGESPAWLNVAIFFFSSAAAFLLEAKLFTKNGTRCRKQWLAFALICLIGVLFIVFTFFTPRIPLFQNPLNGTYGISG